MAHFCSQCRYQYPNTVIQQTVPEDQRCPQCGSSSVSVEAPAGHAAVSAPLSDTVDIKITAHLWPCWAGIAIDRALVARRARERAEALPVSAAESYALGEEFDASLVAVAASAHALDALYGSLVVRAAVQGRKLGENRHSNIREALKLVFVSGPFNADWIADFEWLFDLRDAAVHHEEKPKKTVSHPSLGTHTGPEYVDYSTGSADKAVTLMLDVLRWCVDNPKPAVPDARTWAEANRPVVADLESRVLSERG
ncbi:hypothetical protein [Streptomyces halobius]|uniref:HEPN domain-containing protein n=1 Tax=Streptomyces halobius TaxID=2879846 RepID=A0ABY4M7D4_9ACTN|nr:hypothetical protein [Streptomyces halobius]UQA92171.1 hypothetical protein K9S39_10270 [Streptomyces halobius]